jgi:hypothetical protein
MGTPQRPEMNNGNGKPAMVAKGFGATAVTSQRWWHKDGAHRSGPEFKMGMGCQRWWRKGCGNCGDLANDGGISQRWWHKGSGTPQRPGNTVIIYNINKYLGGKTSPHNIQHGWKRDCYAHSGDNQMLLEQHWKVKTYAQTYMDADIICPVRTYLRKHKWTFVKKLKWNKNTKW